MKLGIDIMGGDFAPETTVLGAIQAAKELSCHDKLVLIGDDPTIRSILKREHFDASLVEIVHTSQVIAMSEHPAKSFAHKTDSSIVVGFKMLKQNLIDSFSSAGNTGAVLVGAMYTIKSIPGIIRPCITVPLPKLNGGVTLLLDAGINSDCKPDVLYQYAILGSLYANAVYGIGNPKVGLLNIGEEEEKGNLLTKATHDLMKGTTHFNFIGNVQGYDLSNNKADVVVCDGFTGNIVLKQAESIYTMAKERNIKDEYFDRFNFESIGGTPVLGINGTVMIGHGVSNIAAIKKMLLQSREVVKSELPEKIKEAFK
ncbi:MAG: phosphate acyltransferase [Bacteroidia bacterium]|nr:phosphate acyltransferase [Bacteroidia bacterium]